eukprot:TRINITY_DN218_c0_g3_i1.p1 TRINITY_DN218_c0_g3~~TRINITY_DN218_c0_g3_i1.p1  ORF type:complete len:567 (+),score=222.88 TRINITY_DN218_c0_g3_i1:48-1748(+)
MTQSSSLYVGDLAEDVSEANLFDIFREIGPVLSIRVCRDAGNRKSLGYAYVNFQNPLDAERAIETMNFTKIKGKSCRIMWCKRDPSLRKSGNGNIFIKNLAETIDNKALHDTFAAFGRILSCKVVCDDKGQSLGYGYVHFESEESAKEAAEKVDQMLLNGKQVYVGKFERKDTKLKELEKNFTNCYVKFFRKELTDDEVTAYFTRHGEVDSVKVSRDDNGESRGYAYVNFKNHEDAVKFVEAVNETEPEGFVEEGMKISASRHQNKAEREHIKRQCAKERQAQFMKYANLYIKNLDDSITSETLKEVFSEYGDVMSAKVMMDPESNTSKGFGFVSFKDHESAQKAIAMNGRILSGKPLYVSNAQRKDARQAQLMEMYRNGTQGRQFVNPNDMQRNVMNAPMGNRMGMSNMGMQGMGGMGGMGAMGGMGGMGGMAMGGMGGMGMGMNPMARMQGMPMGGMQGMQRMMKPPMPQPRVAPMPAPTRQFDHGLDPARLVEMPAAEQKNVLGESLFTRISSIPKASASAAKITGMLLEMDNAEILNLLDSPELLRIKVDEALHVLGEHQLR